MNNCRQQLLCVVSFLLIDCFFQDKRAKKTRSALCVYCTLAAFRFPIDFSKVVASIILIEKEFY